MFAKIVKCPICGKQKKTIWDRFKCCGILQNVTKENTIIQSAGYTSKREVSSESGVKKTQKNKPFKVGLKPIKIIKTKGVDKIDDRKSNGDNGGRRAVIIRKSEEKTATETTI